MWSDDLLPFAAVDSFGAPPPPRRLPGFRRKRAECPPAAPAHAVRWPGPGGRPLAAAPPPTPEDANLMEYCPFLPTPAQIAAGCAEARSHWSAVDRARALRGRADVGLLRMFDLCRERAQRRRGQQGREASA